MIINTNIYQNNCISDIELYFPGRNAIFFDIETTGLSRRSSHICMIGALYYTDSTWQYTQWFLDHPLQEKELLLEFSSFLKLHENSSPVLVHYNGDTFDLPFMKSKYSFYGMIDPFVSFKSLDLYKIARKLNKIMNLPALRLKNMEQYLGVFREDSISGKELIRIYQHYIQEPNDEDLQLLFLHNREDILNLPALLPLLGIVHFLNGQLHIHETVLSEDQVLISCRLLYMLPESFCETINTGEIIRPELQTDVSCHADSQSLQLVIRRTTDTLKHFFADYKNYYYLPLEDQAIHKDIAVYVDSSNREKAKKENCYQKKTAAFLPDPEHLFAPSFRMNYKDAMSWFIPDESWAENKDHLIPYVRSMLCTLPIEI